jgi:HD-like signal output (HDOD) protein
MPVDLVLVMGKRAPAWCLLVPLRYRNRWGRFLYVDGGAEQLESLFEFEVLARLVVMQLRAARARPHQPAEGLRKLRNLTLRERQQRQRRRTTVIAEEKETEPSEPKPDPLSRKGTLERPAAELRDAARLARFDEDGHLVEPLKPREILARIGEIPPMPHVASQLLSKLNDPDTTVQSLQELISTDQALSARLLQIANSSLYGNMREVSAISEAVMRLGFNSIRSWLLSTITRTVFAAAGSSGQTHRLWRQSVLCAMASQTVAESQASCDPEVAFVAGLLQNIGLLLLARNHPDVFLEIHESCSESLMPYYLGERQAMGFDHADLGALLLSKWGLGEELISAVASHHRLELAGESRPLAATIALGEEIALRLGEGPTQTSESSLAETPGAEFLQVSAEGVESIYERVAELALDRSIFQA